MHVKQMDSLNTKHQRLLRFSSIKYKETSIPACRNWYTVSPLEFKIECKPCTGYYHKFLCSRLQTHSRVFHSANIEQQKQASEDKRLSPTPTITASKQPNNYHYPSSKSFTKTSIKHQDERRSPRHLVHVRQQQRRKQLNNYHYPTSKSFTKTSIKHQDNTFGEHWKTSGSRFTAFDRPFS